MPWHIGSKGSNGCSGFPVILNATGKVVGCHPTKAKAQAHLAALNINAKGRSMAAREYRQITVGPDEYRVASSGEVIADVVRYMTVDDYGTRFTPDVFTESLATRMPRMVWGHNWLDPIGLWNEYDSNSKRLRLKGQLDLAMIGESDMPAVPSAHRAYAQLRSGTIDQWSVGFLRQEDRAAGEKMPGITDITKGILDEASAVLVGAVPGTKTVSIRSSSRSLRRMSGVRGRLLVPAPDVQELIVRLETGEIDLADALSQLKMIAIDEDDLTDDEKEHKDDDPPTPTDETPPPEPREFTSEQVDLWKSTGADGEPPEDWDGLTAPSVTPVFSEEDLDVLGSLHLTLDEAPAPTVEYVKVEAPTT
jgi:HK97 family phage prohead protease